MRPYTKNLKCAPEETHWEGGSGDLAVSLALQGENTQGFIPPRAWVRRVSCAGE